MENNYYQNGKIYTLFNLETDEIFYVGSTCQELDERMYYHEYYTDTYDTEKGNSQQVYKYIKDNDIKFDIQLHHSFPCNNLKELTRQEGTILKMMKGLGYPMQNQVIPGRTMKEWYQDNHKKILENAKLYRQIHEVKLKSTINCGCGSSYSYENRHNHLKTDKHRQWSGKERLTFTCECGSVVSGGAQARGTHNRTKKHLDFIGKKDAFKAIETVEVACECGKKITVPKSHKDPMNHHKMKRHRNSKAHKEWAMSPEEKAQLEIEKAKKKAEQRAKRSAYQKEWYEKKKLQN